MLYLVVGPPCSGKSTLIASRLAARRLPTTHACLAREFGRLSPEGRRDLIRGIDPMYVHFSVEVAPRHMTPSQRASWEALTTLPRPTQGIVLVADPTALEQRAARRVTTEPVLRPRPPRRDLPGPGKSVALRRLNLGGFDPVEFSRVWSGALRDAGITFRVVDTTHAGSQ